jgi:hypothetical protein
MPHVKAARVTRATTRPPPLTGPVSKARENVHGMSKKWILLFLSIYLRSGDRINPCDTLLASKT